MSDEEFKRKMMALMDRIEIQDVICAVTLHSDLNEPIRQYTRDCVIDYATVTGPESSNISIQEHRDRLMSFLPGFEKRQHQITNFEIKVDGDTAVSRSQASSVHIIGDKSWDVRGVYTHRLVRTESSWKICYQKADLIFETGAELVEVARARVEASKSA